MSGLLDGVWTSFAMASHLVRTPKDILTEVCQNEHFDQCEWLNQEPGWWCQECGYSTTSQRFGNEHQQRPGHRFTHRMVELNGDRHLVLGRVVSGTIQTLFPTNLNGNIPSVPLKVSSSSIATTPASQIMRNVLALTKDLFDPPIVAQDDPRSVHPFINISGFRRWLGTMTWKEVEALKARMQVKDEWGKRVYRHCRQMMNHSFSLCVPLNYTACCHVNSATYVSIRFS